MKNKFIHLLIPALALIVVIIGASEYMLRKDPSSNEPSWTTIDSFEECAKLYPVMESYPEQCRTPGGVLFVRDISADLKDLIVVDSPKPNAFVSSPLVVTGKARGNWFFEASFPVRIEDAEGKLLTQVPAQAKSDWMTTEFVPFSARLLFGIPGTETGVLILKNDNPSGDASRDKEIRIPIKFSKVASDGTVPFSDYGKPYSFSLGETIVFPDGLSVTLTKINDSRCKSDVQCIWAGELAPVLTISGGRFGKSLQEIQLGTVNNNFVQKENYGFSLKSATTESADIVIVSSPFPRGASGVSGYIHIGPTCPVEQYPSDPKCADRGYMGLIMVKKGDAMMEQGVTKNGQFVFSLTPGDYSIVAGESGLAFPRCEEKSVTVLKDQFTDVDISCDSGIR